MPIITAKQYPSNIHVFIAKNWREAVTKCDKAFHSPEIQGAVWLSQNFNAAVKKICPMPIRLLAPQQEKEKRVREVVRRQFLAERNLFLSTFSGLSDAVRFETIIHATPLVTNTIQEPRIVAVRDFLHD